MNTKQIGTLIIVLLLLAALPGMTAVLAQGQDPSVPGVILQSDPETGLPVPVPDGRKDAPAMTQKGEAYMKNSFPAWLTNESEPNGSIAIADSMCSGVLLGCVVGGKINGTGDVDFWKIRFEAGWEDPDNYPTLIDVDAYSAASFSSPLDSLVCIYDGAGLELACSDDTDTTDSLLYFNFEPNRDYFVSIRDYYHRGGSNYKYQLVVSSPLLLSATVDGTVAGIPFAAGDILAYYGTPGCMSEYNFFPCVWSKWAHFFDISDLGVNANVGNISAGWRNSDYLLLGFPTGVTLPGIDFKVTPRDVVIFDPVQLGPATSGTFRGWWRGDREGLTTADEKLDAIHWPRWEGTARLIVSTVGQANVSDFRGRDFTFQDHHPALWTLRSGGNYWATMGLMDDDACIPGLAQEDIIAFAHEDNPLADGEDDRHYFVIQGNGILGTNRQYVTQKDVVLTWGCEPGEMPGPTQVRLYWHGPNHGWNYSIDAIQW